MWLPRINGVVRCLLETLDELNGEGHLTGLITPLMFRHRPMPYYPEMTLLLAKQRKIEEYIAAFSPDYVHIVTEGLLGLAARKYCLRHGKKFTTSFHSFYPYYLKSYFGMPESWSWKYFKWFHSKAFRTLVPSESVRAVLLSQGISNLEVWGRGINPVFFSYEKQKRSLQQKPILLYVGRISKEKNIEAFLNLPIEAEKRIIGDGPLRKYFQALYPQVVFDGFLQGTDLALAYSQADCLVFPSLTDTFGNVVLESLASGTPVAAFPAPGVKDLITDRRYGAIQEDLSLAVHLALREGDPEACRKYARTFSWRSETEKFLRFLVEF